MQVEGHQPEGKEARTNTSTEAKRSIQRGSYLNRNNALAVDEQPVRFKETLKSKGRLKMTNGAQQWPHRILRQVMERILRQARDGRCSKAETAKPSKSKAG